MRGNIFRVVLSPHCFEWCTLRANEYEEHNRVGNNKANGGPYCPFELATVGAGHETAVKQQDRDFGEAGAPEENRFNDPSDLETISGVKQGGW